MIKATFIIPAHDNNGRDLTDERICLEADLITAFGGYTGYPIQGGWMPTSKSMAKEPGYCYFIAMEDNEGSVPLTDLGKLRAILQCFKSQTLQESIYLDVSRDVEVEFI